MTMEATDRQGPRIPWAGKKILMENVEEELAFLWKMSADNMRTSQNTNVRTSVLNLVVCAPDVESAKRASASLRSLSSTHIARVTILILDREQESARIDTWITLRCFSVISDLMRHCFEQTTLLVTGSAVQSIAHILQPLLKPHLPVYLWWVGDPPDNDSIFSGLVELSNRIIVDSTGFFNLEQDVRTLAQILRAMPDCALSDLNWGRITPWRQLVIQFFDVSEYRAYLSGVRSIEIEHAAAPLATPTRSDEGEVSLNPACALLLAGWLKGRLGWSRSPHNSLHHHDTASGSYTWRMKHASSPRSTAAPGTTRARTAKAGATASIVIRPQIQSHMRPGSICLVRLTSIIEEQQATFTISREGDPELVLTSVEIAQGARPQRTVNLASTQNESELLYDELEIMGHDQLFEQTLQEVADLLS
jgi:glucose-6-phosphate dehydrogenase assembly protein OpcA